MKPKFVHLRVHSEFSLVDGIIKIESLIKHSAGFNMPAVALTEQSNLFSLVKFYKMALDYGIKAIVGCDVYIFNPEEPGNPFRLTLLAQNKIGYASLIELISKAYVEGQHQSIPMLKTQWIEENYQGLISLSGGMEGDIGRAILAKNTVLAEKYILYWYNLFKQCFYIEIQRVGKPNEESYIKAATDLALKFSVPVVATNDVRFINKTDFDSHEVRVCINQGQVLEDSKRAKNYTEQQYLRSPEEMSELFADVPEALENSVEIAKRCSVELNLGKSYLPNFIVPNGLTLNEFFIRESHNGIEKRLQQYLIIGTANLKDKQKTYMQRLEIEIGVITQMGFASYFLIVADFIQWARNNKIPVGPGRGSGAGSLVAYALKITDVDPIEFNLLFERFLNPERISMPDFDIDFCMDGRDKVINYVAEHYGRYNVSQIITYGSMAAKAVIRDVGRVLSFSYGFVDSLAKLVPFEVGITLNKALQENLELKYRYETEDDVKSLLDMALSLEGIIRNAGKHAGGVVISPTKLTDFTPLYCEQDGSNLVTQFDKDDVEAVGLVKFDFLGLRTLTIIDNAIQTINAKKQQTVNSLVDISQIPRDDNATYKLLKKCQTTSIFQLESRGMKELINKLKPDCFDDIIALVALFRPGPLESGMVDNYIKVKHGAKAEYAHPLLKSILSPTNGVILYQEQVMQIARELGGYTLGAADILRRAMSKKKPEEMARQRAIFTSGAVKNKIDMAKATYIYNLMEKFSGYGFNKSHSVAYALVAYQTAWLKVHYPSAFMAAAMSSDMDNTDKIIVLIEECKIMKLILKVPDINISFYQFTVNDKNEIIYGMGAIKGVGKIATEDLLKERKENGKFISLYDLCKRVGCRKLNRRMLETLIKVGVFDSLNTNRAAHLAELESALKMAEQHSKMNQTGQNDLFGLSAANDDSIFSQSIKSIKPWTKKQCLEAEKNTFGFYLTGHPIAQYEDELNYIRCSDIATLLANTQKSKTKIRVAGLIAETRISKTKKGATMGFATLDDGSGKIEVVMFSKTFAKYRDILSKDALLIAEGRLDIDNFSGKLKLTTENIYTFVQAREKFSRCIFLDLTNMDNGLHISTLVDSLKKILLPFTGGLCPLYIKYSSTVLQLGDEYKVHPTSELIEQLQELLPSANTQIKYN